MRIFFDCEFTGLQLPTTLISIGLVSEDGKEFYEELSDYNPSLCDEWIQQNVLAKLYKDRKVTKTELKEKLIAWLAQWDRVEIWSDCLAYDWVLFCDVFGGAFHIPKNVYYIPFDLATAFWCLNIDPDITREAFAQNVIKAKHNALYDAKIIRDCFHRLEELRKELPKRSYIQYHDGDDIITAITDQGELLKGDIWYNCYKNLTDLVCPTQEPDFRLSGLDMSRKLQEQIKKIRQ